MYITSINWFHLRLSSLFQQLLDFLKNPQTPYKSNSHEGRYKGAQENDNDFSLKPLAKNNTGNIYLLIKRNVILVIPQNDKDAMTHSFHKFDNLNLSHQPDLMKIIYRSINCT